jgi:hypothetical protein
MSQRQDDQENWRVRTADLDHDESGSGYLGFAHRICNQNAGAQVGRARQRNAFMNGRRKAVGAEYYSGLHSFDPRLERIPRAPRRCPDSGSS